MRRFAARKTVCVIGGMFAVTAAMPLLFTLSGRTYCRQADAPTSQNVRPDAAAPARPKTRQEFENLLETTVIDLPAWLQGSEGTDR